MKSTSIIAVLALCLLALAGCSSDKPVESPTISGIAAIASEGSKVPHLSVAGDGAVIMSWLEPSDDGVTLKWSALAGDRWLDATEVASGEDWFVNWADFPSVTPITDSFWAAHWLAKKPGGTYAYDVAASLSRDGGKTWGEPFIVHDDDDSPTEHGFVTLFPWQEQLGALWLDGRNTKTVETHMHDHNHHSGGMTLRSARFDESGMASLRTELDALVCDCCQTDVAVTASGPIAVYRNRTEDEIRDIHVAKFADGNWGANRPVADDGWEIAGCPVNGPAIDAVGQQVAVAWFTAANDDLRIRLARSIDEGDTFAAAIDVDSGQPVGRVDIIQHSSGATIVSWIRALDDGSGELVVRVVTKDGELEPIWPVARLSSGRISGFPQMVESDGQIVFAWTDVKNGISRVRSAKMELDALLRT